MLVIKERTVTMDDIIVEIEKNLETEKCSPKNIYMGKGREVVIELEAAAEFKDDESDDEKAPLLLIPTSRYFDEEKATKDELELAKEWLDNWPVFFANPKEIDILEHIMYLVNIIQRAKALDIISNDSLDEFGMIMDIESAYLHFGMDLDKLCSFSDYEFTHDVVGIGKNIVRGKFPATDYNYFCPRCAR